jgi:Tat protein translocase TatB subunit
MFGISSAEVMVILLVALVVLGPDRLPIVARKVGQVLGEVRKVSSGFEAEMRTAMFEAERPTHPPPRSDRATEPDTPTGADASEAAAPPDPDRQALAPGDPNPTADADRASDEAT